LSNLNTILEVYGYGELRGRLARLEKEMTAIKLQLEERSRNIT